MNLIDWPSVVRNTLWILGLSMVLAALSYVSWLAARCRVHTWRALSWPAFGVPSSLGLCLFSANLGWGAARVWEHSLWILLAVAFLFQAIVSWREARRHGWHP